MDKNICNKIKKALKREGARCTFYYRNEILRIQVASNCNTFHSAYIICQEFQIMFENILNTFCVDIDEEIISKGMMGYFGYIICK